MLSAQALQELRNWFAVKPETGEKLPKINEAQEGTIFILKDGIRKYFYIMTEGNWEQIGGASGGGIYYQTEAKEISFTYADTLMQLFTNDGTPLKLLQIIVDIRTAFTRTARIQIASSSQTLLYDTEVMPTIIKITPKFLNYSLTPSDILTLTITGTPSAGEGKILLVTANENS